MGSCLQHGSVLRVLAVHVSAGLRASLVWTGSVCASESCGLFGSLGMMCDLDCDIFPRYVFFIPNRLCACLTRLARRRRISTSLISVVVMQMDSDLLCSARGMLGRTQRCYLVLGFGLSHAIACDTSHCCVVLVGYALANSLDLRL